MKTLAKEHQSLDVVQALGVWTIQPYAPGWRVLNPAGAFLSENYFDLAGMSQREKTLFFEAATVQEILNPQHTAGVAGDSMVVVDLMCTSPLTDNQLLTFYIQGNLAAAGTISFDQTIYARLNQYVVDLDTAAWGSMVQVSSNQIGSLDATASDRIYSYRLVVLGTPTQATNLTVFGCRHVLRVEAKSEDEYQYLMRLMKSYELQQSYDED